MPLYEYECRECKNRFEIRQRIVEDPISVCPTCGGNTRRLIHPVGIVFKGSGFYVTDNRKTNSSPSTSSETKTDDKVSESKTSESKPAESKSADKTSTSSTTTESKPATPATT